MSIRENIHFNGQRKQEQLVISPEKSRVNLNNLMKKLKEEKRKIKRNNLAVSVAAFSAAAVFGIILTL
jgi:hypothetical protein|tara:strand:- start:216 stop:419 length:204 start_codon:yes stop_codon:yes gene_type:complete